MFADYTGLN